MALNAVSQEEAVEKAINAIEEGRSLRFSGPCGSGKTTLCKKILTNENLAEDLREGKAFMLTSRRPVADDISLEIARSQPYLCDPRPVKTANALAFLILKRANPDVRLLDVTSQTKLITDVIKSHIRHAERGDEDECRVCGELKRYAASAIGEEAKSGTTTARAFEKVFLPVGFITRLREAFARFDELGVGLEDDSLRLYEKSLEACGSGQFGPGLSWNMVQSLRKEYRDAVSSSYGDDFFDNSSMINAATAEVKNGKGYLPKAVIVDDCQDLTLAAYDLLKEMHRKKVPVIFVGNDDESVQGYKGAMPDVLSILESGGDFECQTCLLSEEGTAAEKLSKSEFLRGISNNIGSWFVWDLPVPDRPGKPRGAVCKDEECFECWKLNSEEEELDRLVHEISGYMFGFEGQGKQRGRSRHWSDLAVISSENAFLRKVGERLKANRIPFRYTSVNEEPVKDSVVVKAMLSYMKLAYYASLGEKAFEAAENEEVASLIKTVLSSPLFQIEDGDAAADFEIASKILVSVLNAVNYRGEGSEAAFSEFEGWKARRGSGGGDLNSLFILLLTDSEFRKKIIGRSALRYRRAFEAEEDSKEKCFAELGSRTVSLERLLDSVDEAKKDVGNVPQLFWDLWNGTEWVLKDKADNPEKGREREKRSRPEVWQKLALESGEASENVNEWLDQLIRLQHLAQIGPDGESVPEFAYRVCGATIDSDSLARVAPKDESVTLSSPIGVESERFEKVWIPNAQQDVWNKLIMDDLFFTRLLESVVTNERIREVSPDRIPPMGGIQDRSSEEGEYSNLRSLLVASSRSNGKTVFLAVEDEERTPLFRLENLKEPRSEEGKGEGETDPILKGLELRSDSLAGMSDYCRAALAKALKDGDGKTAQDAARALKFLSGEIKAANPAFWNFTQKPDPCEFVEAFDKGVIRLNPSKVDSLWSTPVPSIKGDNRYLGPTKAEGQMQFGTMVHACAQWAAQQGLDRGEGLEEVGPAALSERVAEKLMRKFDEEEGRNTDLSPLEKASYRRRAEKAMKNLANYFVTASKPAKAGCPIAQMPPLVKSEAEKWIRSSFTLEEIFDLAKNTRALRERGVTEEDFIGALEELGNFKGLDRFRGKAICLTGQIDRLEEREGGINYVVDYKTGSGHCNKLKGFSDLQLLCYQLLLYFPGVTRDFEGGEALWDGKAFADKSMLFSVEKEPYPASAKDKSDKSFVYGGKNNKKPSYERYFQPCIFNKKGGLNDGILSECQRKVGAEAPLTGKIRIPESDNPVLKALKTASLSEGEGACLLPWVFRMLSKFFYAVRYVDSAHFDLREEREGQEKAKEERDRIVETMTIYGLGE